MYRLAVFKTWVKVKLYFATTLFIWPLLDTFLEYTFKEKNSLCGRRGLEYFFSFISKTFYQDMYVSFSSIYYSLGLCVSFRSQVLGFNSIHQDLVHHSSLHLFFWIIFFFSSTVKF